MAKPDDWSERLWEAYKAVGESDAEYVASCNRFLEQMLEHQLHATAELIIDLRNVMVLTGDVFFSDRLAYQHQRGLPSLAQAAMAKDGIRDELDVYRRWYSKRVQWPEECFCVCEPIQKSPLERTGRFDPWFLSGCVQLARRSLEDPRLTDIDVYGSRTKEEDTLTFRPAESWSVIESRVIDDRIASDHRPVLTVLEWIGVP
jgi:hypothetical protein